MEQTMRPIEVENLHVRYPSGQGGWVEAVKGLSFSVEPGEIVGFLGPNGAGKSSTLKALMGFQDPSGGKAAVFGLPAGSVEARSRVGYLPEVAMYYPYLTPLETLTMYGELQGLRGKALRKEATELLERIGLGGAMKKQNRALSKGMLQRVGIAQALLGNPSLLILDEVTSGLDPLGRHELRDLLKDRRAKGSTLFFSSHELAEVDMLCDRILIINKGLLVDERMIDALKEELRQFRIVFRGEVSLLGLGVDKFEVSPGVISAGFESKRDLVEALQRINASGAEVLDVVAQEGSLESYFIKAVGGAA
jgi:ABC-2 type transport system ATP-binding protein